jgi:hypothetical protein
MRLGCRGIDAGCVGWRVGGGIGVDPRAPIGAGVGVDVGTGVGVPCTDDGDGGGVFAVVWCGTAHWWGAGRARRVGRSGLVDMGGTCRGVWWGRVHLCALLRAAVRLLRCNCVTGDDDDVVVVVVAIVVGACRYPGCSRC